MCGILLHYSAERIVDYDVDYNNIDIKKVLEEDFSASLSSLGDDQSHEQFKSCNHIFESLVPKILSRGSDFAGYDKFDIDNDDGGQLEMFSSVLSLRSPFTKQPLTSETSRFIVQFNGELYNEQINGDNHKNDTEFIFNKLNSLSMDGDENDITNGILQVIGILEGEFAYCIYDKLSKKIYFGKDILGKKSLSYSICEKTAQLYISSCFPVCDCKLIFQECENASVYIFHIDNKQLKKISYNDSEYLPNDFVVNGTHFASEEETKKLLSLLNDELNISVESRIKNIFPLHGSSSNFAILFSGGLDCTILAYLAAKISKPGTAIDLLNVSFFNPRTNLKPSETPDRKLSLKNWLNLSKIFYNEKINFQLIEIDIPYEEYLQHKPRVIQLIYPNDTEMDLSIAIAFYFASRGSGRKICYHQGLSLDEINNADRVDYLSTCKVLLSGLGADELFGGYTRHERIFTPISNLKKKKQEVPTDISNSLLFNNLQAELQLDITNLDTRNLARDDRIVSSWSKEMRYPFLDVNVISLVTKCIPLSLKLNYNFQTGEIIRKYLLRELASHLGMEWVRDEAKRAIQFGAKSAKMEIGTGRMKGTDKINQLVN
ncbi:hypothetical protein PACTADRAFT_51122 [Pachysolen tannophilus NRRL Y-2460]|uniref:Glutamine amidotransferase type-2 domain-containing protein n=1 Tax=Pachysolen tannophilus NRRL Y-2460 TaxID=669874 RepID=A0A1E4TR78_PACTA|nr:hypothetical protein PACTADRAFT_51122 [Pachysolen tannophilus NRRL Y-2460]